MPSAQEYQCKKPSIEILCLEYWFSCLDYNELNALCRLGAFLSSQLPRRYFCPYSFHNLPVAFSHLQTAKVSLLDDTNIFRIIRDRLLCFPGQTSLFPAVKHSFQNQVCVSGRSCRCYSFSWNTHSFCTNTKNIYMKVLEKSTLFTSGYLTEAASWLQAFSYGSVFDQAWIT